MFKNNELPFELENDVNVKGYYYDEAQTIAKYKIEHREERLKTPRMENISDLIFIFMLFKNGHYLKMLKIMILHLWLKYNG